MKFWISALAAGGFSLAVSSAQATPVFNNSTFQPGSTVPSNQYYNYNTSVDGWQSSSGNVAYTSKNATYLWDNGSAGDLLNVVALNGYTSGISQQVDGFTIGSTYTISALVNARAYDQPSRVDLTMFDGLTTYLLSDQVINSVDPTGNFADPFYRLVSSSFVATSNSLLFDFYNDQQGSSTVLLTSPSIVQQSLADTSTSVPEPSTLALLGFGLMSMIWVKARKFS